MWVDEFWLVVMLMGWLWLFIGVGCVVGKLGIC